MDGELPRHPGYPGLSAASSLAPSVVASINKGDFSTALEQLRAYVRGSSTLQKAFINDIVATGAITDPAIQAQWSANFQKALDAWFKLADATLTGINLIASAHDIASSNAADVFTVTAVQTQIALAPATSTVRNSFSVVPSFTVNVPAAGGTGLSLQYPWQNTGNYGYFCDLAARSDHCDNGPGVVNHTFTSTLNQGIYTANATGQGTDTITVTVTALDSSGNKQVTIPLGSATATVTVATSTLAAHRPRSVALRRNAVWPRTRPCGAKRSRAPSTRPARWHVAATSRRSRRRRGRGKPSPEPR